MLFKDFKLANRLSKYISNYYHQTWVVSIFVCTPNSIFALEGHENKNLSMVVLTQNSLCNIIAIMKHDPKIIP